MSFEDKLSVKLDNHVDSFQVPIIDMRDIKLDSAAHTKMVEKIRHALEKWRCRRFILSGLLCLF